MPGPAPSMGRITGSASIETLVRVGIEKENGLGPESKMVVLHDFTPCVDDELEVKRGQIVHVLYQVRHEQVPRSCRGAVAQSAERLSKVPAWCNSTYVGSSRGIGVRKNTSRAI